MKISEELRRTKEECKKLQVKIIKMKKQATLDHNFKRALKLMDKELYNKIVDLIIR